jgi:hypothetical protein
MPKAPTNPAKVEGDFGSFERALQKVLAVPHSKIKAQMEAEKKRKKLVSASRASRDRD